MMKERFKVRSTQLNYRSGNLPSINNKVAGVLMHGDIIEVDAKMVVKEKKKDTGEMVNITWGRFTRKGKKYWVSVKPKWMKPLPVDFGQQVAAEFKTLAEQAVALKSKHTHGEYGVNCESMVSRALMNAGCNPNMVTLHHRSSGLENAEKIAHCTRYKPANKTFKDLPRKYKVDGTVIGYASSVAIVINGQPWAFNLTGKTYTSINDIRKTGGYHYNEKVTDVLVFRKELP